MNWRWRVGGWLHDRFCRPCRPFARFAAERRALEPTIDLDRVRAEAAADPDPIDTSRLRWVDVPGGIAPMTGPRTVEQWRADNRERNPG